jgi:restriction system protein
MSRFWMVRAGEAGYLAKDFERARHVGIGWQEAGDFTGIVSLDEMRHRINEAYPDAKPLARAISAATAFKFRKEMKPGDRVITYDPEQRQYLVGAIEGDYEYRKGVLPDYNHVRKVNWQSRVSRDALKPASRNSLGSLVTIFEPGEEVWKDIQGAMAHPSVDPTAVSAQRADLEQEEIAIIRKDIAARAHEFITDKVRALSPDDLEELAAALLRAMGFKARVTPTGPDRGRDVVASPDGLGLQPPRIVAEVKRRPNTAIGAPEVRSFIGGLREGDRGLYISTGGFTREARYEAERASTPIALVDLEELALLLVEHYEGFDSDGRALIPLVKVYWPAS